MATQTNNHLSRVVGVNIAAARARKGWTQQQLATALGTSISRVSGWERGEHLPQRSHQPAIADVLFGGDLNALFRPIDNGSRAVA
jgi:transcriptional regulator with XRE-family HTH domain